MALATGLVIARLGWNMWPILLLVGVMCIARVVGKNHTPLQTIAGALYSWGILLFARSLGLV